jgi:multidrug efflux pump subunit AcrA (membrane-fusion protein)
MLKKLFLSLVAPSLVAFLGCGGVHLAAVEGGDEAKDGEEHEEKVEGKVTVRAEAAKLGPMIEVVQGLGKCEAIPDRLATLTPAVEGHVEKLLAKPGDRVKAGQAVVHLAEAIARADLAEKTATRDGLKASLKLLESKPRAEERRVNELAIEQAKLGVEKAQRIVDRLTPLFRNHEVSDQQMFEAKQAVEQAKIAVKTAESQLNVMMIGPRPEAIAEAQGKIQTADAAVLFSQTHLEYHTIRSPIDGVLDSLTCHPGQTIAIGAQIGEVVDASLVYAAVWLPGRSAERVRPGQKATIKSAGAPSWSDRSAETEDLELTGVVESIGKVADPQTGNIPIRVLVENPKEVLTLGEMVAVEIIVKETPDQILIPFAAVLDQGEGPVVHVIREGKSKPLHPKPGASHDGWIQVSGTDLKPGEFVITDGGYNLPEGTTITIASVKEGEDEDDKKEDAKKADDHEKSDAKKDDDDHDKAEPNKNESAGKNVVKKEEEHNDVNDSKSERKSGDKGAIEAKGAAGKGGER